MIHIQLETNKYDVHQIHHYFFWGLTIHFDTWQSVKYFNVFGFVIDPKPQHQSSISSFCRAAQELQALPQMVRCLPVGCHHQSWKRWSCWKDLVTPTPKRFTNQVPFSTRWQQQSLNAWANWSWSKSVCQNQTWQHRSWRQRISFDISKWI